MKTRNAPGREVSELIPVTDTLTGRAVGRVVALSPSGMEIASNPDTPEILRAHALYQLTFALPADLGETRADCGIEVMSIDDVSEHHIKLVRVRFILIDPDVSTRIGRWCLAGRAGYA